MGILRIKTFDDLASYIAEVHKPLNDAEREAYRRLIRQRLDDHWADILRAILRAKYPKKEPDGPPDQVQPRDG